MTYLIRSLGFGESPAVEMTGYFLLHPNFALHVVLKLLALLNIRGNPKGYQ